MALMVAEVYDAFLAAKVPEAQARKAAEAVALTDDRFARIDEHFVKIEAHLASLDGDVRLLRWMGGFNLALSVAILLKLLA
jgi:hypothetical protein